MLTSVTLMRRRIFEFPIKRFQYIHALCGGLLPDSHLLYSLNFINFIDKTTEGQTDEDKVLTNKVQKWLEKNIYATINKDSLKWFRTGPKHSQILELD